MGESSSSSSNVSCFAREIEIGPASDLPPDCSGPSRISSGRMEGGSLSSSVEESIERSKSHWSVLREFDCGNEMVKASNVELFQTLRRHPTWGHFFKTFGEGKGSRGVLVLGEKFAEGGQAELYDVQVQWSNRAMREQDLREGLEWVLKVFKKGTSLGELQAQWPQEMFNFIANAQRGGKPHGSRFLSDVFGGTLLKDGRFAFLMIKEQEDLRSLIDRRSDENNMWPLSGHETFKAMYEVAFGMHQLHDHGIVHRDLKASNVLISKNKSCNVADYECSVGVVGTGFFRAPEILQACKDRSVSSRREVFTKAADVYSYGMICYEILTGKLPFEGHPLNDYNLVINGGRLELPQYVDGWICKLLNQCWHSNPASRPSSKEILEVLAANSLTCLGRSLGIRKLDLNYRILQNSKGSWMILEKWELFKVNLQFYLSYWLLRIGHPSLNRLILAIGSSG